MMNRARVVSVLLADHFEGSFVGQPTDCLDKAYDIAHALMSSAPWHFTTIYFQPAPDGDDRGWRLSVKAHWKS